MYDLQQPGKNTLNCFTECFERALRSTYKSRYTRVPLKTNESSQIVICNCAHTTMISQRKLPKMKLHSSDTAVCGPAMYQKPSGVIVSPHQQMLE